MPKNRSAYIRYHVINRQLTGGKKVTFNQLKNACEDVLDIHPLGVRTIQKDINIMRTDNGLGFYAPIVYDRNLRKYYYTNPDFTIDQRNLSDDEIRALVFASESLQQFKGMKVFDTFQGTVQRLIDAVDIFTEDNNSNLQNLVEFEHSAEYLGSEYLEPIINALVKKIPIKIIYKSFYALHEKENIIHPYYLKEFHKRWYLIGLNETKNEIRTYSLDRIKSVEPMKTHRFMDSSFDPKEYYKNSAGIIVEDKKPKKIILSFTKEQSNYVITQPMHHSQKLLKETKNAVLFKYFLIPTFEFKAQILGWTDQVKVIEPRWFRDEIKNLLQISLDQYAD